MGRNSREVVLRGIYKIADRIGQPVTPEEEAVMSTMKYTDLVTVSRKMMGAQLWGAKAK